MCCMCLKVTSHFCYHMCDYSFAKIIIIILKESHTVVIRYSTVHGVNSTICVISWSCYTKWPDFIYYQVDEYLYMERNTKHIGSFLSPAHKGFGVTPNINPIVHLSPFSFPEHILEIHVGICFILPHTHLSAKIAFILIMLIPVKPC